MRVAAGDRDGALQSFQSILALLGLVLLFVGILIGAALFLLPIEAMLHLGPEAAGAAKAVLGAHILSLLLYQFCLLFYAGIRCEGHAAAETVLAASWRLGEAAAFIAVALTGGGLALAALAGLAIRIGNIVFLLVWLRVNVPWLKISFSQARLSRAKELAGPALSYMLVPISHAVLIQGPVIILGAIATPVVVTLYAVTRSVSRLGIAAANMINLAFTPEYSFAYGRRDLPRLRNYFRFHAALLAGGVLLYLGLMQVAGGFGVGLLSRGEVVPVAALTGFMAIGVVAEMLWSGLFSPLSAINAHRAIALLLAVSSAASLVVSVAFAATSIDLAVSVSAVHVVVLLASALLFARTYRTDLATLGASPVKAGP
ncbi:polysaccharide biosynthesis protein [Devosia faecipullorum]|uniref:hypothetical protein n=1 Tax=Devosia faecipullorum TaxID=2755039 RepID=UPI00187B9181|nr:hypothetical protein [Devosia faecipullorum]MBE7731998.1 hypothetical protein [Devosia faecipullorum]